MSHCVDCPKCGQEIDVTDCNFLLACDEYDHECPHCETELLVSWEAIFSARRKASLVAAVHVDPGNTVIYYGQDKVVTETDFNDHDVTLHLGGISWVLPAGAMVSVIASDSEAHHEE